MWGALAALALTAAAVTPEVAEPAGPEHNELAVVPVAGGDTDIGFGAGFFGSLTRLAPGARPFVWRVEAGGFISFKSRPDQPLDVPYQDVYMLATVPGLFGGRGRLELRPSYTHETNLRYHGLGNGSVAIEPLDPARDYYTRTHPAVISRLRLRMFGPLDALAGVTFVYNQIDYQPGSTLARDVASPDPVVRDLLHVERSFGLPLLETGLVLDARDDEIAPSRGQYHTAKVRVSPGGLGAPYHYAQLSVIGRFYVPIVPRRLTAALRLVGDGLFGDVPFYELGRYAEDTSAVGGPNGVRGVPSDRYLGKVKAFGNLELRWTAAHVQVLGSRYGLGAVAFCDAGRVWARTSATPELDGTGPGLKYGLGGGLRIEKGSTFVVRGDVAWSPDARPVGGYFLAGHIF